MDDPCLGGSRDRNAVARRPSVLNDSNTPGHILRSYSELHPAKSTHLNANEDEGKENRPPADQTLRPITDYPSPPPAPRIDNGSFDLGCVSLHLGAPNTNAVTELNWGLDSFTNMNMGRNLEGSMNLEDNVTSEELGGLHPRLGLDVVRAAGVPPPEECDPEKQSEDLMLDCPRAPRPDMGSWSADILEEITAMIPALSELRRGRRPDGIKLSHSVAQSPEPSIGTGTEDRSFGWDTGLGLTLDMVADADAELPGMNLSLGNTSEDNSLSLYTPESSFFHSSYGVIDESAAVLFPRMLGAGSRLELDAPPTIVPIEDKLLGLGLGSSSGRALGAWSSTSAAARDLQENGCVADPTRRPGCGISHLDDFSLSRLEKLHWSRLDKSSLRGAAAAPLALELPPGACSTATSGSVRAATATHTHTRRIRDGLYARETIPGHLRGADRRTCSRGVVPGESVQMTNNGMHAYAYMSNYGDLSRGWTLLPPIDLDH